MAHVSMLWPFVLEADGRASGLFGNLDFGQVLRPMLVRALQNPPYTQRPFQPLTPTFLLGSGRPLRADFIHTCDEAGGSWLVVLFSTLKVCGPCAA